MQLDILAKKTCPCKSALLEKIAALFLGALIIVSLQACKKPDVTEQVKVHRTMGQEFFNTGQLDKAIAEWRKTIEIDPVSSNDLRINMGLAYYRMGKFDDAKNMWEEALKIDPKMSQAMINLGNYYLEPKHDYDAAEKMYLQAAEIQPDYFLIWTNLGNLALEKGDKEKAVEYVKKGYSIDPKNPQVALLVAEMTRQAGKPAEAMEFVDQALVLDPGNIGALSLKAELQSALKDYAGAEKTYSGLIESYPDLPATYVNFASMYIGQEKELDKAQKLLDRGEPIAGVFAPLYKFSRAHILFLKKEYAEAKKLLEEVAKTDPGQDRLMKSTIGGTYNLLGRIALAESDKEAAKGYFGKSVEIDPKGNFGIESAESLKTLS